MRVHNYSLQVAVLDPQRLYLDPWDEDHVPTPEEQEASTRAFQALAGKVKLRIVATAVPDGEPLSPAGGHQTAYETAAFDPKDPLAKAEAVFSAFICLGQVLSGFSLKHDDFTIN